ncbi:MAG: lipopolysaccharide biosynthesis protein [Sphingopyxis sp.]|nr:lipopolysaccharide biosynthesis protein [Sphingopyxis sp.]
MTDLKRKTVAGILWSVARAGWSSAVTLVLFILLARILEPEDFGLFALASILIEVGRILSSGGIGDAVIRAQEPDDRFLSTVFWLNISLSFAFAGLIAICAPLYDYFIGGADSLEIIFALALTLPLSSCGAVHGALLAREFSYAKLTLQAMMSGLSSGVIAITLALSGFGVWSLVAQAFVSAIVSVVFAWVVTRWRPSLQFDTTVIRSIAAFGASLAVTQLVWMLLVRVQDLFIASFYGPGAVGLYRIAWRMIEIIANMLLGPMGGVSLVSFARMQSEPERRRHAYGKLISYASFLVFPMILGFGATAGLLMPLIFGKNWDEAVPVAQVLSLMVVPFVFNFLPGLH